MSVKRQATTELNHENWDQEDPEEHEEMGSFKIASKDVLEKRVIRTAKRRAPVSDEEPKKTVFSGFGFNKSQPASFDFLSKLTNGNGTSDSPNKVETPSSLFASKPTGSPVSGIFGVQTSPKTPFGTTSTTQSGSLFGVSSSVTTTTTASVFSTSKADSTVSDSPFKSQSVTSTSDTFDSTKTTPISTKFGIPNSSSNVTKSLFTTSSNSNSNLFKIQPTTNTTTITSNFGTAAVTKPESNSIETKKEPDNSKKIKYYSKLKGLNESVSDWIKKHVEQTPLCILTPIFKDYENYLKEIQDEYHGSDKEEISKNLDEKTTTSTPSDLKADAKDTTPSKPTVTGEDKESSLFKMPSPSSKPSIFAAQKSNSANVPATFPFGMNTPTSTSSTSTTPGFSFGVTVTSQSNVTSTSSSFSVGANNASNGGGSTFSFGAGKPFSFNSNIQKTTEKTDEANDEDDTPPKTEFTPIVEENSVYDKRCKIFVKKDGNFVDKGVGTLYIKKVEETGKHQLLVRANTNLGTILVNLILAAAIPTQRMGKNNVMMVCIPTPDSKPPPTPILVRVKTPEEADELLETLNKYKT